MIKERAMMLADALESGEYKQGTDQLRNEHNQFCCLGVACNIFAQHHPELAAQETDPTTFLQKNSCLPWDVKEWFGFFCDEGGFRNGVRINGHASLAWLNDTGTDFKAIANIIRENWENL